MNSVTLILKISVTDHTNHLQKLHKNIILGENFEDSLFDIYTGVILEVLRFYVAITNCRIIH